MDHTITITTWNSCHEESNCNDNKNNNNNNNSINNNNNNNDTAKSNDHKTTFNQRKSNEPRHTRLQRQEEQQHYSQSSLTNTIPDEPRSNSLNEIKAHRSVPVTNNRGARRKRLQRQRPTELDDVDFAYAADLEEEDEDEELGRQQCHPAAYDNAKYANTNMRDAHTTPSYAMKYLQQFQQQHHSTPFNGQPSSLPNCFATAAAISSSSTFHHREHRERRLKHEESFDSSTTTTTTTTDTATSPASPLFRRQNFALLKRDNSTHSESSSRYSSVDSLLEARKPDPEAILINLGFGPVGSEDILSRIPKRFLKPSQVRGIDTEAFIRRLQLANNLADHSVLGYRGLTGNPDIPPSRIVAKIMQRFEVNERKKSMGSIEHTI